MGVEFPVQGFLDELFEQRRQYAITTEK